MKISEWASRKREELDLTETDSLADNLEYRIPEPAEEDEEEGA